MGIGIPLIRQAGSAVRPLGVLLPLAENCPKYTLMPGGRQEG